MPIWQASVYDILPWLDNVKITESQNISTVGSKGGLTHWWRGLERNTACLRYTAGRISSPSRRTWGRARSTAAASSGHPGAGFWSLDVTDINTYTPSQECHESHINIFTEHKELQRIIEETSFWASLQNVKCFLKTVWFWDFVPASKIILYDCCSFKKAL